MPLIWLQHFDQHANNELSNNLMPLCRMLVGGDAASASLR